MVTGVAGVAPSRCSTSRNFSRCRSACRHAAGNDLLAVIVADLGKHHLKPFNSITSDRPHMGRHRWRVRWPAPPPVRRFGSPPPAAPGERHPHSSRAGGLHRGYFIERQEQQCPSPPVRKQRPIFAMTRSYSGLHRSGIVSATGLSVCHRATAHPQGKIAARGALPFRTTRPGRRARTSLSSLCNRQ
jgi:hypothetical protein